MCRKLIAGLAGLLAFLGAAIAAEEALTIPRQTPYTIARRMLVAWGYQPFEVPARRRKCAAGRADICAAYYEAEVCGDQGLAKCVFLWTRGATAIEVHSTGETELVVDRVRCRRGCQ
jgi:hypothetical protein